MRLPGGFSPRSAFNEAVDTVNPFDGNTDHNVFSEISFAGGDREPVGGGWVGPDPTNQPQVQGQNTNGQTGGGQTGGGGGYVAPDPYARWGGQAAFNALRSGFTTKQGGYKTGAQTSLRDVGNTYDQKTRNFINEIEDNQGEINRGGAQNALNLRQSMQNIVRGIQTGIKSGNVALAGMNALSSGAAEAMARAYAKIGNTQSGEARGQAQSVTDDLRLQQGQLNRTRDEGVSDLNTFRDTETGRVRNDFSDKLDNLAVAAQAQGIDDVVQRSLVDQVLDEALGRLAAIDRTRSQRLSGIQSWTPEQIMQEAIRMEQAGQAGNAFEVAGPNVSYGGGAPAGAPVNQVPIFLRNRDELTGLPMVRGRQEQ